MKLIDADELSKYMETTEIRQYIDELNKGNDNYSSTTLYGYIEEMPTAYDVDEVIRQIEALRDGEVDLGCCPYVLNDGMTCTRCYAKKAAEIVKRGGMS